MDSRLVQRQVSVWSVKHGEAVKAVRPHWYAHAGTAESSEVMSCAAEGAAVRARARATVAELNFILAIWSWFGCAVGASKGYEQTKGRTDNECLGPVNSRRRKNRLLGRYKGGSRVIK